MKIIEAIQNLSGAIGLWESIKKIICEANLLNLEYVLICEDDHQFTGEYTKDLLFNCIDEAQKNDADILCGGVSWFEDAIQTSENLFWVKKFSGSQFIIFFKKFFQTILDAEFLANDTADYKISELTSNKYFIHPFVSTQKEFGYSDVTPGNNGTDRVEELFETTAANVTAIKQVRSFYYTHKDKVLQNSVLVDFGTIIIPTYVINMPERTDRRDNILDQFVGKKEFDVTMVEACKHEVGAVGLWQSIRKVIELAIANDDDVIVICEDDHEFTDHYNRDCFIRNILDAHEQGCDILSGGIGGFDFIVPITANRYWVNYFWSTQFIVVYNKFFETILNEPYDDTVTADYKISQITSHKMILYPFISVQKDFGYSDVTQRNNKNNGYIESLFSNTSERIKTYKRVFENITG